jgi:hypothetical protein
MRDVLRGFDATPLGESKDETAEDDEHGPDHGEALLNAIE